jgi:hypothetical protein
MVVMNEDMVSLACDEAIPFGRGMFGGVDADRKVPTFQCQKWVD